MFILVNHLESCQNREVVVQKNVLSQIGLKLEFRLFSGPVSNIRLNRLAMSLNRANGEQTVRATNSAKTARRGCRKLQPG